MASRRDLRTRCLDLHSRKSLVRITRRVPRSSSDSDVAPTLQRSNGRDASFEPTPSHTPVVLRCHHPDARHRRRDEPRHSNWPHQPGKCRTPTKGTHEAAPSRFSVHETVHANRLALQSSRAEPFATRSRAGDVARRAGPPTAARTLADGGRVSKATVALASPDSRRLRSSVSTRA